MVGGRGLDGGRLPGGEVDRHGAVLVVGGEAVGHLVEFGQQVVGLRGARPVGEPKDVAAARIQRRDGHGDAVVVDEVRGGGDLAEPPGDGVGLERGERGVLAKFLGQLVGGEGLCLDERRERLRGVPGVGDPQDGGLLLVGEVLAELESGDARESPGWARVWCSVARRTRRGR